MATAHNAHAVSLIRGCMRAADEIDVHVGRQIQERRRALGVALSVVARGLCMSQSRLRHIEAGALRAKAVELAAVADLLAVPVAYFFRGFGPRSADGTPSRSQQAANLAFSDDTAAGNVKEIAIARGHSLAYLPLMVMQEWQLVEKHAHRMGLGDVRASYLPQASGAATNAALISGKVQFASSGVTPLLTLWDETDGAVKALTALNSAPSYLSTRNAAVRSVADFADDDRINVFAPRSTVQAILLQMAAAKTFGIKDFARLDQLTIGMPAPESAKAMISGGTGITADFALPPFSYAELDTPGVHLVLKSTDLVDAPTTNALLYSTTAFYQRNPLLVSAVMAAVDEAIALLQEDRARASEAFLRIGCQIRPGQLRRMVDDPTILFEREPHGLMQFAEFMHRVGTLANRPNGWRDLFFEREAAGIDGEAS